ncbi:MAG: hypothetical protein KJ592_04140 [Nanoarchaeota archaeon]|nr:hypothetical protein [Nanoarchaeota archaeon]
MEILDFSSTMMAFSTFLGVLFAGIYYFLQIVNAGINGVIIFIGLYLNSHLLFMLYMKVYLR